MTVRRGGSLRGVDALSSFRFLARMSGVERLAQSLGSSLGWFVVVLVGYGLWKCSAGDKGQEPHETHDVVPIEAPTQAPQPTPLATAAQLVLTEKSADRAISLLRPFFGDAYNEVDPASAIFAVWASDKSSFPRYLRSLPDNKLAEAMKDPEGSRGRKICRRGTVSEISIDRSVSPPLFVGGIVSGDGVVRFAATGDTRGIVDGSAARFCGVFTGTQSFDNAIGGTTRAAFLVGVFE